MWGDFARVCYPLLPVVNGTGNGGNARLARDLRGLLPVLPVVARMRVRARMSVDACMRASVNGGCECVLTRDPIKTGNTGNKCVYVFDLYIKILLPVGLTTGNEG